MKKSVLFIFFVLVLCSNMVSAIETKEFRIELANDNSGIITVNYLLSEREQKLMLNDKQERVDAFKAIHNLDDNGHGSFMFREEEMTRWNNSSGENVLEFFGFPFTYYKWSDYDWLSNSPNWKLLTTDYQPESAVIVWPDGVETKFEKTSYLPNLRRVIT